MTNKFPILDELNEPLAILDEEAKLVYANKFFYTFAKTSPRQISSTPPITQLFDYGEFNFFKYHQQALLEKKVLRSSEIKIIANNSKKHYHGITKLIPFQSEYIIWSFYDFTNEFELQQKYRQQVDELKYNHKQLLQGNKHKAIGEVYETLSHDINNPLTSSVFYLNKLKEILAQKKPNIKDSKNLVDKISFQVQTVTDIVCNMKRFLIENTSHKEYIDLIETIRKSHELAKTLKIFEDLDFTLRLPAATIITWGNQPELIQVFINVVKNAAEALQNNEGYEKHIEITLKEEIEEQLYRIEISDNGPGIADSVMNDLFTPFATNKTPEQGTGLGLSIAKKIIDDHNGQLDFLVKKSEGTTFSITLPTVELASFVNNKLFSKIDEESHQIILLIKDLPLLNQLNDALTKNNYNVLISTSLECQQEIFTDFVPNLVITDDKKITATQACTNLLSIDNQTDIEQILKEIRKKL